MVTRRSACLMTPILPVLVHADRLPEIAPQLVPLRHLLLLHRLKDHPRLLGRHLLLPVPLLPGLPLPRLFLPVLFPIRRPAILFFLRLRLIPPRLLLLFLLLFLLLSLAPIGFPSGLSRSDPASGPARPSPARTCPGSSFAPAAGFSSRAFFRVTTSWFTFGSSSLGSMRMASSYMPSA